MWCLRRRALNGVDTKNKKGRTDTVAFDLSKVKQLRSLTDPGDTRRNLNINLWTPNCDQKLQLQLYNCTEKLDTLLIAKKIVKLYYINQVST